MITANSLRMLRIRRSFNGDSVVLTFSGRIDEESLSQLKTLIEAEEPQITLDLKEVTLAGGEAVRFLAQCEEAGASIQNCPAYVRDWISQERRTR